MKGGDGMTITQSNLVLGISEKLDKVDQITKSAPVYGYPNINKEVNEAHKLLVDLAKTIVNPNERIITTRMGGNQIR